MNIRRILAAAAATLLCTALLAQNERPTNWFIGAGGGLNIGFDGNDFLARKISHSGNGTALDIYAGKYFNNTLGFRAGYQGLGISDQYVDYGKTNYTYVHGDLLFRLANFFVPYVHAGYAKVENGSIGGGAGLMLPIKIGKRLSVIPDLKATAFNGSVFPAGEGFGRNISGTLGLQVALGKIAEKAEPVEVFPPIAFEPAKEEPEVEPEPVKEEPVKVEQIQEEINKSFQAVALFDFDSSKLTAEAIPVLDKAVAWLAEYPTVKGVIEGHTDSVGTDAYNQGLSERRAKAVYDYLVEHGIDKTRLAWKGFGESRPVDTNSTPEGRHHNRRIELILSED